MEDVLAVYTRPRDPDHPLVLPGRDLQATDRRDARADPDEAGAARPHRLRVRTQRHRQPVHAVRPTRRLAPRRGHRSPRCRGLCSRLEGLGRHPTSRMPRPLSWSRTTSTSMPKASLYEAFPAAEARRLAERFEWHYTPKHGSWLDFAEGLELGGAHFTVPRSPYSRQANPHRRSRRLGA